MKNDGTYVYRLPVKPDRVTKDDEMVQVKEPFVIPDEKLQIFAHQFDSQNWHITEKSTGCAIGRGPDIQAALKDAEKCIDAHGGRDKVLLDIKSTLENLAKGLEYDCVKKEWIDVAPKVEGPGVLDGGDQ
jgi:hypothetical protein